MVLSKLNFVLSDLISSKFPAAPNQHRPFWGLRREPGDTEPFSAPWCALPHSLQNRVPRVQVLLPLPKTALLLLQWRCFLSLGGTSWQRGTAAPCAVRVVGRVRASSTQATSRLSRQARQVRSKCYIFFRRCSHPLPPVLTCSHPLQHPKRTRFRPFLAFPGAFFSFSLLSGRKIFMPVFVHPAA